MANKEIIDWELSVQLADNNAELAKKLLHAYIIALKKVLPKITTTYKEHNYTQLRFHIHQLHGASCYCGVPRLKQIVAQTELALEKKQLAILQALYPKLLLNIGQVLRCYSKLKQQENEKQDDN